MQSHILTVTQLTSRIKNLLEETFPDVWVEGDRYGVSIPPRVDPRGTWTIVSTDDPAGRASLRLEGTLNRLEGSIEIGGESIELETADARTEAGRIQVSFPAESLGYEGLAQLSGSIDEETFRGWAAFPDGSSSTWRGERVAAFAGEEDAGPSRDVPDLDLPDDVEPILTFRVEPWR